MICIEHLYKTFGEGTANPHPVLRDINLTINDSDVFGIIGSSGAGKSTLVRCINLLERPTSGHILIDGKDITGYRGRQLLDLRASIGMIFQNFSLFQQRNVLHNVPTSGHILIDGKDITGYRGRQLLDLRASIGMIFQNFSLFQQRNVLHNVTFPLELGHRGGKAEREDRARELLELVGLADKAGHYPCQLSGGQQQRVAIARALANGPSIMLCDEATSALDTRTTVSILELLADINKRLGVTMVMITHSLAVAQRACNRIAVIDAGTIVEEGPTEQVFSNPTSPITRDLLRYDNLSTATTGEEEL